MNNNSKRKILENKVTKSEKELSRPQIEDLSEQPFNFEYKINTTDSDLHTILNKMGDSVFVKDDQSRIIFVNDAFCELFDLSRDEILGHTLSENVPKEEKESFMQIDGKVLSEGLEIINEETLTLNGQKKILSTRKSRFENSLEEKFLVGVVRDITEQKKTEQILINKEAKLRKLNTTKDKLFSIIAHDLRGPAYNTLRLSEFLKDSVMNQKREESEEYLQLLNVSVNSSIALLENLLEWSKLQNEQINFEFKKTNVEEVIKAVVDDSKVYAKTKKITITSSGSVLSDVFTDEKILQTILRNLVSNAVKFTSYGGEIKTHVKEEHNRIKIIISDNGIGMDDYTLKNLFSFSSNASLPGTKNEKGSGFGLIVCKEFITELGGEIWVTSKEGEGSAFTFTLPLKDPNTSFLSYE